MRTFAIVSISFLAASAASAHMCVTQSRGLYFVADTHDSVFARNEALSMCFKNRITIKSDCTMHMDCSGGWNPYPSGYVTCRTASNGQVFLGEGATAGINHVTEDVVNKCKADWSTRSSECEANLSCNDLRGAPQQASVLCITTSKGLEFRNIQPQWNEITAKEQVVKQCRDNRFAGFFDCSDNVKCINPFFGYIKNEPTVCTTYSQGRTFSDIGDDINIVSNNAVNSCLHDYYTNTFECSESVSCRVPEIVMNPAPTPPIPTPIPPTPVPVPVPPTPAPIPDVHAACRLTSLTRKAYEGIGHGRNWELAEKSAKADALSKCRSDIRENQRTCNRGSFVCRPR